MSMISYHCSTGLLSSATTRSSTTTTRCPRPLSLLFVISSAPSSPPTDARLARSDFLSFATALLVFSRCLMIIVATSCGMVYTRPGDGGGESSCGNVGVGRGASAEGRRTRGFSACVSDPDSDGEFSADRQTKRQSMKQCL